MLIDYFVNIFFFDKGERMKLFSRGKSSIYLIIGFLAIVYLLLTFINYEFISHWRNSEREKDLTSLQKQISELKFSYSQLNSELDKCKTVNQKVFKDEEKEEVKKGSGGKGRQLLNPWRDNEIVNKPQVKNEVILLIALFG